MIDKDFTRTLMDLTFESDLDGEDLLESLTFVQTLLMASFTDHQHNDENLALLHDLVDQAYGHNCSDGPEASNITAH